MSRSQRLAFAAIAAVIAVVAVVVLTSGGDDQAASTTTTSTTAAPAATATATATGTAEPVKEKPSAEPAGTQIEVAGGEVVGGPKEIRAKEGDVIRFTVKSDVADEVHVHGYDVKKEVAAGGKASFAIPAKIVGIFEVELEGAHLQVASLRVEQ